MAKVLQAVPRTDMAGDRVKVIAGPPVLAVVWTAATGRAVIMAPGAVTDNGFL